LNDDDDGRLSDGGAEERGAGDGRDIDGGVNVGRAFDEDGRDIDGPPICSGERDGKCALGPWLGGPPRDSNRGRSICGIT